MKLLHPLGFVLFIWGIGDHAAQAQTPTFDFPLQEGNVWVYRTVDFPNNCTPSNRCKHEQLQVMELTIDENLTCGVIQSSRFYRDYSTNASIPISGSEFVVCQRENRIYWYPHVDSVQAGFLDRFMIADFDRDEMQPWVVQQFPENFEPPYMLRRMVGKHAGIELNGHRVDYLFDSYWADSLDQIEDYYGGLDMVALTPFDTFTSGLGFTSYYDGYLRGFYVNGVLTGDTATVWTTSIEAPDSRLPSAASLDAAYPNPFNPTTVVGFQLTVASKTRLAVYDLLGREVAVLVDEVRAPGAYQQSFDAAGLPSGVYVVVLDAGGLRDRRMITLIR